MLKRTYLLPVTAMFLILFASGKTSSTFIAPGAIICLTYDDGLDSHLSTVLPQLDSAGLKATFFLNAIRGSSNIIGEASPALTGWRHAAEKGHELANHTLFHPCPQKLGWAKDVSIEAYTTDRIIKEIELQNGLLALVDPSRKIRSYAFPCNNVIIAGVDYSKLISDKKLVRFGRAGGDRNSVVTDYTGLNKMQVPSWMVEEGTTLNELISFAEKVKDGGLAIYQFHGVGAEFFRVSAETHRAFLDHLARNRDVYRVVTFSEAMELAGKK